MPIRNIGSNYRNKIHQMMDDVEVIRQSLPEGSYVRISYPSERQTIFMRIDKIFPVESSFYGISTYEGIIDLSFQGPAYVYTYDEFENPINLECYENYNLNNAINRNTSSTTDDSDSIDIITESDFHNAFMGLMDKFYFNNYTWPDNQKMADEGVQLENYGMAVVVRKNLSIPVKIIDLFKVDIIIQIPQISVNTIENDFFIQMGKFIEVRFSGRHHIISIGIFGSEKIVETFDFSAPDGSGNYLEDKFHLVFVRGGSSSSLYVYIESLRTGKRFNFTIQDSEFDNITEDMEDIADPTIFYADPAEGTMCVERVKIWRGDELVSFWVPLLDKKSNEPLFYNLVTGDYVSVPNGDIESW